MTKKKKPNKSTFSPLCASYDIFHSARKRLFDLLFSLFVLIAGFPLYCLIALAVKGSSKGPIFYRQRRVGRGGEHFYCYKFRTMYYDADHRLSKLLQKDPLLAQEWAECHKLKDDPRVTPLGKLLRKFSLDELPQFWNVVKGDLSVVGPRPVVEEEVQRHLKDAASLILRVRPGITGPWQISGRSDESYQRRIDFDRYYVDHWSFFRDMKIVILTIPAVFTARGAY